MAQMAMDAFVSMSEMGAHAAPFAGKYAVLRVLGKGGMGTVFEARHLRLGHRVAIKVLGSELRDYPELVTRFEREARAAGSLSSPHAVRVLDIDLTEDGTPFIVMELLSGRDLAHVIEIDGPLPIGRAVRFIVEACDAIAEAHRLGIVHRDLKPSNLFLRDGGGVKVLDFGIAKRVSKAAVKEVAITQGVAPLGTPQYMSPEQVRCAKDVDGRTDIWSLGVTLFELLTGQTPFAHAEPSACIASIAADVVPDPRLLREDISDELAFVILHALEKRPEDRPQTIEELVRELAPFVEPDEDGKASSTVHRILRDGSSSPREQDTLGAEDFASFVRHEPFHREPTPESVPLPLVVSRAPQPKERLRLFTRSKPVRSIGLASACVLGLAALVITPRCVGMRLDAPSTTVVQTSSPANAATSTTTTTTGQLATAEGPKHVVDEVVDLDIVEAAPSSTAAPITMPAIPAAVVPMPSIKTTPTTKRAPAKPALPRSPDSPVHGGLSSPGF